MMPLCWAIVIFCLYSSSESTIIIKEPGESITLKCSSEGCPNRNDRYAGIYMYHTFTEKNEVYYYSTAQNSETKVRSRHKGRIWKNGTPMDHDITITNLTVDDSGIYTCVYAKSVDKQDKCDVYTVFVRGVAPCPRQESLAFVLIISTTVISILLIIIFILLIIHMVKQRCSSRRARISSQGPNDYVYEVMTKKEMSPAAAPEQSGQRYNGFY